MKRQKCSIWVRERERRNGVANRERFMFPTSISEAMWSHTSYEKLGFGSQGQKARRQRYTEILAEIISQNSVTLLQKPEWEIPVTHTGWQKISNVDLGIQAGLKDNGIGLVKLVRRHKDFCPSPVEHNHILQHGGTGKVQAVEREALYFKFGWAISIWNRAQHPDKKAGWKKSQNNFWCWQKQNFVALLCVDARFHMPQLQEWAGNSHLSIILEHL